VAGTIKYTKTYEYIKVENKTGVVGISAEASDKLGDIYLVDMPETGRSFKKDEETAVIESVKAAADVFIPVDGKVIEVNEKLAATPELVSSDPLGEGWIYKIEIADLDQLDTLMDYEDFKRFVGEEG